MLLLWHRVRGAARLARVIAYLFWVAACMRQSFARLPQAEQHRRVKGWSTGLLRRLGVQVVVHGQAHQGAKLIVANHVSWLDIITINAVDPSRFVSKAEVAQWPVVGRMVTLAGTIYLQRERRRDAVRALGDLAQTLRDGQQAAVFPEGTTGTGHGVLHFHANLLQSAIEAQVPIQPVALRYRDDQNDISAAPVYVGDTTLAQSLWCVACASGLTVHLHFLPAVPQLDADRRALARQLHNQISHVLSHE